MPNEVLGESSFIYLPLDLLDMDGGRYEKIFNSNSRLSDSLKIEEVFNRNNKIWSHIYIIYLY